MNIMVKVMAMAVNLHPINIMVVAVMVMVAGYRGSVTIEWREGEDYSRDGGGGDESGGFYTQTDGGGGVVQV